MNSLGHQRETNKYCDLQDSCKLLIQSVAQYEAVVQQNKDLQAELRQYQSDADKDSRYLSKIEEANMLLEQENEKLKQALETISELAIFNETYCKPTLFDKLNDITRVTKGVLKK